MEQIKVKCLECDKKYFTDDSQVPENMGGDEAFKCECPYCNNGHYAELAE